MERINGLVDSEKIHWDKFESFLRREIPNIPHDPLKVRKFSEGYSNLTYLISFASWEAVMRKPPFGEIPPKAHDMKREYTILHKINPVFPLAPKPFVYYDEPDIMGSHFYVMEKKEGITIDDKLPATYGDSLTAGPLISSAVIDALVQLQSIDYMKANLSNIGKPQGYLERQVHGWIKRYKNSKTDEFTGVTQLEDWFISNLPESQEATILHNDFKLNNMVFDYRDPRKINGVLDWELSTIGDPLTDIGSTIAYWGEKSDPDLGINMVTDQPGFYSRRDMVGLYAKKSGRDVTNITYYVAFAFYRLAVILQQIYYRWKKGELKDDRFENLNKAIGNLFIMADLTRNNKVL